MYKQRERERQQRAKTETGKERWTDPNETRRHIQRERDCRPDHFPH